MTGMRGCPPARSGRAPAIFRSILVAAVLAWGLMSLTAAAFAAPRLADYDAAPIHLRSDVEPARARDLVSALRRHDADLRAQLGTWVGRPLPSRALTIWLFAHRSDYQRIAAGRAGALKDNGGFYEGAERRIVASWCDSPPRLLQHEIAHAALADLFADQTGQRYRTPGWPVWFEEGLAEWTAGQRSCADSPCQSSSDTNPTWLAYLLQSAATADRPAPVMLAQADLSSFSSPRAPLYYAQAWATIASAMSSPEGTRRVSDCLRSLLELTHENFPRSTCCQPSALSDDRLTAQWLSGAVRTMQLPMDLTAPQTLQGWTEHGGAQWSWEPRQLQGVATRGYGYLTHAVLPTEAGRFHFQVRSLHGRNGIVLGLHDPDGHLYRWLVAFSGRQMRLLQIRGPNEVIARATCPISLRTNRWQALDVRWQGRNLSVLYDHQPLCQFRVAEPLRTSLIGVFVDHGAAQFRSLAVAPLEESR